MQMYKYIHSNRASTYCYQVHGEMEKSGGEDIPDKGIVEHLRGVFKDKVKLMIYRTGGH